MNLRVLQPLTRGPHGQPSPLRTPHGRSGARGIFLTSRGQVPRGWPTGSHSMATGFPIPRVCCLVLSAILPCRAVFATPRCPFPLCHIPLLALSPYLSPHPVLIPHRAASNPTARAHWILMHPGAVSYILQGSLLSRPLVFGLFVSCWTLWELGVILVTLLPRPIPVSHPATRAYTPPGCLPPVCLPLPAACYPVALARGSNSCLMRQLLLSALPLPVCSVLCVLWRCCYVFFWLFVFVHPVGGLTPPPSLCVSVPCPVVSCCFRVFFTLLPACTHGTTALVIGLRLPSVLVSVPLAPAGRSPWRSPARPGGRPSLLSPSTPSSVRSPPRPSSVASVSPLPLLLLS